ncbi:hypothetical protein BD410DRAFT_797348 [Rickenella mellea]|uniref:Uncharacterized protein n=1 Tax=Rickenella mellea TaxID=50990 RepID=A0A4Y7PFD0_9AGAM|nr:hypothetical protein BD410DRAFT_797348 [Rickenella mellea]
MHSPSTKNTPRRPVIDTHIAASGSKHVTRDATTAHKPRPVLLHNHSRFFEMNEGRLVSGRVELASTDAGSSHTSSPGPLVHTPILQSMRREGDSGKGKATTAAESRVHHEHRTPRDESGTKQHTRSDRHPIYSHYRSRSMDEVHPKTPRTARYSFASDTGHTNDRDSDNESGVLVDRTIPKGIGYGSRKLRKPPPKARTLPTAFKDSDIREEPSRPPDRRDIHERTADPRSPSSTSKRSERDTQRGVRRRQQSSAHASDVVGKRNMGNGRHERTRKSKERRRTGIFVRLLRSFGLLRRRV